MKKTRTQTLTTLAVLAALAAAVMLAVRIPVSFLTYDPKDVIVTIIGFILGPLASLATSSFVCLFEMVTVSSTGVIGLAMNLIASCAFSCTAAAIYRKKQTMKGAVTGLLSGCVCMTMVMLLWNYLLTPYFMPVSREAVLAMIPPLLLPFNLVKSALNASITMLLYKPIVTALRRARLVAPPTQPQSGRFRLGVTLTAVFIAVTSVFFILVLGGVL